MAHITICASKLFYIRYRSKNGLYKHYRVYSSKYLYYRDLEDLKDFVYEHGEFWAVVPNKSLMEENDG